MQSNESCNYNVFVTVFHVDHDHCYERRQYLASMLLPEDVDSGQVRFTVVSEPDNDDGDCSDVGIARVSLPSIMRNKSDIINKDIAGMV